MQRAQTPEGITRLSALSTYGFKAVNGEILFFRCSDQTQANPLDLETHGRLGNEIRDLQGNDDMLWALLKQFLPKPSGMQAPGQTPNPPSTQMSEEEALRQKERKDKEVKACQDELQPFLDKLGPLTEQYEKQAKELDDTAGEILGVVENAQKILRKSPHQEEMKPMIQKIDKVLKTMKVHHEGKSEAQYDSTRIHRTS